MPSLFRFRRPHEQEAPVLRLPGDEAHHLLGAGAVRDGFSSGAAVNAILTRIDELVVNPSLVPLLDHYIDLLLAARDNESPHW